MIWRYIPTPESSDGTALSVFALPTLRGPLVTDVFRTRLAGCPLVAPAADVTPARVLSHPGLLEMTDVMLPLVIFESMFRLVIVGDAGDPPMRLLPGRTEPTTLPSWLGSGERRRVPNLASFSDWRPAKAEGAWSFVRSVTRDPLVDCPRFDVGLVKVTLSAPQYEKLILLLRSESSDSSPPTSSSGSSPEPMI